MLFSRLSKIFQISLLTLFLAIFSTAASDNMPPSYEPPGGLAVDKVPLFIVLGFDDNRYADGMEWTLDLLADKKNPAGINNPATFDNTPVKVSFFYISSALEEGGETLLSTWKQAVKAGYEVADHTHTHNTSDATSLQTWLQEIDTCRSILADKLEIASSEILGFRTPYLAFNESTFKAVSQSNLLYECTMTQMQDYNKSMFVWPYTLDNGFPAQVITQWVGKCKIPGLWELPVYCVGDNPEMWPPITGFDSSILTQANGGKMELMFKNALDYRLKAGGNRAPLTIGLHTDTYSADNPDGALYDPVLTLSQRRDALRNFIEYALTKPDVRFVTAKQLIQWMRNPVALDDITYVKKEKEHAAFPSLIITEVTPGKISFIAPVQGRYSIIVYTVQGQQITNTISTHCAQGWNSVTLNSGTISKGTYLVRICGKDISTVGKIVLY